MRLVSQVARAVSEFNPESRALGLGCSLIAIAQLSVLLLTPSAYLFVPLGDDADPIRCQQFPQTVSAYCILPADHQHTTWILASILALVAAGIVPRWTALPHWWVALSVHTTISLPDGGETAGQVCIFFLALCLINDNRFWHWQRPRSDRTSDRKTPLQGAAWAGHWGFRLQIAYIYLNSSIAKLSVAPWQDGTATYYVARMESFGSTGPLQAVSMWVTSNPFLALATTWGTIVVEFSMAVLVLLPRKLPLMACALGATLHLIIAAQLGIISFAFTIIGIILCATSPILDGLFNRMQSLGNVAQ